MKNIGDNIIFDEASDYKWEALNETTFILKFFSHLKNIMGDKFYNYTYYILSSHNPVVVPHSFHVESKYKILFFISDESSTMPVHLQTKYFAIFKSYLPFELPGTNIFPFNIGYFRDVVEYVSLPMNERKFNVFFCGNLNYNRFSLWKELMPGIRNIPNINKYIIKFLLRNKFTRLLFMNKFDSAFSESYIRFTSGFKKGLSPEEYSIMLVNSKIILCPKGYQSAETFRHMEALRAGAIVISQTLPDTYFYRGSPIISVSSWRLGIEIAKDLISNPAELERKQILVLNWWNNICNEESTAAYVSDNIISLELLANCNYMQ